MSVNSSTLETGATYVSPTRRRVFGFVFLGIAALIWLFFIRGFDPELTTKMRLFPGGSTVVLDDWEFNTFNTLRILAFACAALGSYQLVRGFGKRTGLVPSFHGRLQGECLTWLGCFVS
jgi:hypothetical protein